MRTTLVMGWLKASPPCLVARDITRHEVTTSPDMKYREKPMFGGQNSLFIVLTNYWN